MTNRERLTRVVAAQTKLGVAMQLLAEAGKMLADTVTRADIVDETNQATLLATRAAAKLETFTRRIVCE